MGCGSSSEAHPSDAPPTLPQTRVLPTSTRNITSQTAINTTHSTTTSRHQRSSFHPGASSSSNLSTPRTSTTALQHGRPPPDRELLSDHYNHPLTLPHPWHSPQRSWTRAQLRSERDAFFETRVTGHQEIWQALKLVCEQIRIGDVAGAQGILDAAGITLPTGQLAEGAYDERGVLYRLPKEIVVDPVDVVGDDDGETVIGEVALSKKVDAEEDRGLGPDVTHAEGIGGSSAGAGVLLDEKPDKGKDVIERDAVKVKCRLSDRGGPDTVVLIGKSQPVSVLSRRLRSDALIASSAKLRFFHLGKEMKETQSLEEQGWQPGHVVQALVSNFGP